MTKFQEWEKEIIDHRYKILLAILFLAIGILATIISSNYVDGINTISVTDLFLEILPVVDLSFLFVWGIIIIVFIFIGYSLYKPKKFHYILGMLSLFMLIRSMFIILTHLKAPAGAIPVASQGFLHILTYSNDLFFSGHVGLPFLGFLIFKEKGIKYFMLILSIILAITVLLMHVHYSIDVASAYFITFGIYIIGNKIFKD